MVSREQNAMLGCRSVSQFFIVTAAPIQDIEAQHSEVRRQPTKMGVQKKAKFLQLRPQRNGRRYVLRGGSGVNADAVAVLHPITEIDGTVID